MSNDTLRPILKSQYHAALAMLRQAIDNCPDELWLKSSNANAFWQIAYHVIFFTHLYLHKEDADFVPWSGHQDDVAYPSAIKGGYKNEGAARELPVPYTRAQVLEYCDECGRLVDQAVDSFDLDAATCGFWWYEMGKLEHQFVNIRHLQHHTAQLVDRLRNEAGIAVSWVGARR
jgi:hypothetical protein